MQQGQVQIGKRQKCIAQQPQSTRGTGQIQLPNLSDDVGQEERKAFLRIIGYGIQRIESGHPIRIAWIDNHDPLPNLRHE